MANNKTAADQIHNALNPYFNTRENPNWKAVVDAIGESDQDVADLIREVRNQFFIATASRPYLDRLAANYKVSRPKVVGMDDPTLRRYVPVLAYQPKQVKAVIDDLLDIFFFKESTTSFCEAAAHGPYVVKDGWELEYLVDGSSPERILFSALDFNTVSAATASEIVSAINRQAKYSFAVVFTDKITGKDFVRIFTQTIGSKGSIEVSGGRMDIALQLNGLIAAAGSGADTVWTITKIGDTVRFTYTSGAGASLFQVGTGDNVVVDMPGNSGTFAVTEVNISENYFEFQNLLGTAGVFNHGTTPGYYVRFVRPERVVVYTRDNRSVVWEVVPGQIVIEMPATPPVVRRNLKGSAHLNGPISTMLERVSNTSIKVDDAADWPNSGQFVLQPAEEVKCRVISPTVDEITTLEMDTAYDSRSHRYSYSSKTAVTGGYLLAGIDPSLPIASGVVDLAIASIESDAAGVLTVETTTPHNITQSGSVKIYDVTPEPDPMNGVFQVLEVIDSVTFTCQSASDAMPPRTVGSVRIERIGLADSGSPVYLTSGVANTGIYGPYMYDTQAPFIVSSYVANTAQSISTGNIVLNLNISTPNNVPDEQGYLIFDYGLNTQEGPVRYLYKASESTLALDPAYVFKYNHTVGSTITAIRRKGAYVLSGLGKEYAFYVSDPAMARKILQDLIAQVKSAGVFLEYIVRYPTVYYSDYDTYSKTDENTVLLGL